MATQATTKQLSIEQVSQLLSNPHVAQQLAAVSAVQAAMADKLAAAKAAQGALESAGDDAKVFSDSATVKTGEFYASLTALADEGFEKGFEPQAIVLAVSNALGATKSKTAMQYRSTFNQAVPKFHTPEWEPNATHHQVSPEAKFSEISRGTVNAILSDIKKAKMDQNILKAKQKADVVIQSIRALFKGDKERSKLAVSADVIERCLTATAIAVRNADATRADKPKDDAESKAKADNAATDAAKAESEANAANDLRASLESETTTEQEAVAA